MIAPVVWPGVMPAVYPLTPPDACVFYADFQDPGAVLIDHALANHGAISGAVASADRYGISRNFDGIDDLIAVTGDRIGVGAMTIEVWIRPNSAGEGNAGTIITNGQANLYMVPNRFGFTSGGFVVHKLAESGCIPTYGVWHHITVSRNANATASLYIDGALTGSANGPTGTPAAGGNTLIGAGNALGANAFDGLIGLVRLYNRALTGIEVANAYAEWAWRFGRA